jgi:hypothetical protein
MSGQKRRFVDLLSTVYPLGRRPAPTPPSGLFGDIWGQAEAMDNGQWTVINEQKTAIIHYQLCTIHCDPPPPPFWLHSVASGSRCTREEIAAPIERRKESMRRKALDHRSTVYFPLSTLSAEGRPPPPLRGIRGHLGHSRSGGEGEPGSSGDGHAGTFGIGLPSWRSWRLAVQFPARPDGTKCASGAPSSDFYGPSSNFLATF